jgi:hypothetical protein
MRKLKEQQPFRVIQDYLKGTKEKICLHFYA